MLKPKQFTNDIVNRLGLFFGIFTVSCGYTEDGRQVRKSATFTPNENMSERQIKRELEKFAANFEAKCHMGACVSCNIKFSVFADRWPEEQAKPKLKERTYHRYLWKDIGYEHCTIDIMRASLYTPKTVKGSGEMTHQGKGIYTDPPKTRGSIRTLKLPEFIIDMLREYRQWQDHQQEALGDQWQDYDRLFTMFDGKPMSPSTPSNWLKQFQKQHNLRVVTPHSFRHLNASILIYGNLDAKTVSAALGHCNVTTTLDIYTYEFNKAQARTSDAITNALNFHPNKKSE